MKYSRFALPVLVLFSASCSAADRATEAGVLAVAAPIACDLVPVLDPQAKVAAVLCSDLAQALERALLAAPAAPPAAAPASIAHTSTGAHGCAEGLPMVRLDIPGRDPAERVCPEHLATVRRVLDVGHAR